MGIRAWFRVTRDWGHKATDGQRDLRPDEVMLRDYRDKRYPEMPSDPRSIDPERLRALSERLMDRYHYRWREAEANGELIDALFQAYAESDGTRWGLGTSKVYLNEKGESPHPRMDVRDSKEFKLYHYITVRSLSVLKFITCFSDANRLLVAIMPRWDYTLRNVGNTYHMRLEKDGNYGPWIEHGVPALAIVLAILDHLANKPNDAHPWRSI